MRSTVGTRTTERRLTGRLEELPLAEPAQVDAWLGHINIGIEISQELSRAVVFQRHKRYPGGSDTSGIGKSHCATGRAAGQATFGFNAWGSKQFEDDKPDQSHPCRPHS